MQKTAIYSLFRNIIDELIEFRLRVIGHSMDNENDHQFKLITRQFTNRWINTYGSQTQMDKMKRQTALKILVGLCKDL